MSFAENINRILGKGMSSWRWCTTSINRSKAGDTEEKAALVERAPHSLAHQFHMET